MEGNCNEKKSFSGEMNKLAGELNIARKDRGFS